MPAPAPKAPLAQRAARDPALLKKVLANPGLRYKLPASMLSVAQRRARTNAQAAKASAQAASALSDPTTPLSGVNLINVAHTAVDGAYDPQIAELGRQATQATAQGQNAIKQTGGIYDTIAKYQTAALNQQNAQQAAGASALGGITASASGQIDAAAQQQRDQAARDAQIRGGGLDGGSMADLASRVTTAKDSIAQRGQIAGDNLAANAQTNNAVLGGIGAATQQHRGETQDSIQNSTGKTLASLAGQRSTVEGAKGADFVKQLLGLRTQAANEYITESGLGIKQSAAQQASADKATALKTKQSEFGQTLAQKRAALAATSADKAAARKAAASKPNQYGIPNDEWAGMSTAERQKTIKDFKTAGRKGAKPKSPYGPVGTQSKAKDTLDAALPIVKSFVDSNTPTGDIRRALLSGAPADKKAGTAAVPKLPKDYINALMDVAILGGISPANVVALRRNRGVDARRLGYKILTQAQVDAVHKKAASTVTTAAGQ